MIFISYQHDSKAFVENLAQRFADHGFVTWWDYHIKGGDEWKPVIDRAIEESFCMILVVTFQSLRSPYVTYEWSYALGKGKRVIPLVLEKPDPKNPKHPPLHPKINDRQYLDFSSDSESDWERLLREIADLMKREDAPLEVTHAELAARQNISTTEKLQAIAQLERLEHPSASDALARLVSNSDPFLSLHSALALSRRTNDSDERAIPGLARCFSVFPQLSDGLRHLVQFNTPAAAICLGEELHKSSAQYVDQIVHALAQMTTPAAIPYLEKALLSERMRYPEVVQALCRHRDAAVLPAMTKYLKQLGETPNGHPAEVLVLEAIASLPDVSIPQILYETLKRHSTYSFTHDRIAFDKALELLADIPNPESLRLLMLGQSEMPRFTGMFASAIQRMQHQLKSQS